MQEHHPYKMTPDQGWSQMSSILNEAMPLERRSRRFIVFWWTAAAVVTSALITLFALMDKQGSSTHSMTAQQKTEINTTRVPEPQLQNPETNQQDISKSSTIASSVQTNDASKSIVKENSTSAQNKKELPRNSTIASNTNKQKEIRSNSTIANNTSEQKEITSNSTIANNTNQKEETTAILPSNTSVKSVNTEITNHQESPVDVIAGIDRVETQTIIPLVDRNVPSLDFLPSVWASDLEFPVIHVNSLENTLVCCTPKKKLITAHLGIGGVLGFAKGAGVQGGGGVDINLTQRLSVTTDLGYSIYNPDATILGGITSDITDLESDAILRDDLAYEGIGVYLPAEAVVNASGNVISHFVRTIRQWQFSTGLKYDLSGKFFVHGGLTLGFGTNSRSTHPVVTNNNIGNPTTGSPLKVSNSLDEYNVVRSGTTSLYGGLGYKPTARTEIFAQWTHGMDSYFVNDPTPLNADTKRTDYIRGLNMGLRYTL